MKVNSEIAAMKDAIISNLDDARNLELLYRDNKAGFRKTFNLLYPDIKGKTSAQIWHERLNHEQDEISWGSAKELGFVIVLALLAGFIAKFPDIFGLEEEYFYSRNLSFIVFPFLTLYFVWKKQLHSKLLLIPSTIYFLSAIYINFLPLNSNSDTLILACMHLPIFSWAVLGFAFTGNKSLDIRKRLDYLRYNGDLVVMMGLILFSGVILAGITIGLFELIEIRIEEFYFRYIAILGLAASPIIGTYLV